MRLGSTKTQKSFHVLCELLKNQITPRSTIYGKRMDFYTIKQLSREAINVYYVRIKNAARLKTD